MNRLLLLAWPGVTASAASRLIDAGRLPHLSRLVERGAIADLHPDCAGTEAMTWATVATGCRADVHGVLGDVRARDPGTGVRWAGSSDWLRPALWQWVDAAGGHAVTVNWPATHPTIEQKRGAVVSSAYFYSPIGERHAWLLPTDATWPAALRDELRPFRIHPTELTDAEAAALVPTAAEVDQESDPRLARLLISLAANAGAHAAATHLTQTRQPDLLAVQFDLMVAAKEVAGPSSADTSPYGHTPDAALAFYDLMLGRYLATIDDGISVLVVSNGWRGQAGFLIGAGPDVRVPACTTLDVLPLVLRMMRLAPPAIAELAGRIPQGYFRHEPVRSQRLPTVAMSRMDGSAAAGPPDHLLAAGYTTTEPPSLVRLATRQRAADLAQLGRVKLTAGDPAAAVELAEAGCRLEPSSRMLELAARAAALSGDRIRAGAVVERLLRLDPRSPVGNLLQSLLSHSAAGVPSLQGDPRTNEERYHQGVLALIRGQHPSAASLARRPAVVLVHLAETLVRANDDVRAQQVLRHALETEPACAPARAMLDTLLRRSQIRNATLPKPTSTC
ncbi:MAG TPA: alkaline phosphatase family protein [Mesorhizobium sp.]|nr:alkaline phosphatase family protein [Mesorhizobium sp.]